jgi:cellulose synthase operon protein C
MHPMQTPSADDLSRIKELYERGLCLQAYELARQFGDLSGWPGTEARILAGRLAMNLGAADLGRRLHMRAYHRDPSAPLARYYFALTVFQMRGPLETWHLLKGFGEMEEAPANIRSDSYALRARAAAKLRDFETAELWLKRAGEAAPGKPWHSVERGGILQDQDRYEEALEAARQALQQHFAPWYRPAVQEIGQLLQILGRNEEGIDFLRQADAHIESGPVASQLYALQMEVERFDDAATTLERYAALSPMLDKEAAAWVKTQQVRTSYLLGQHQRAAEIAEGIDDDFFKQMAQRLRQTPVPPRVRLDVQFVRQHHQTCAPATIAAIGRFWNMPADHLELAEAICYDGTPSHRQRSWARENGWVVREFTVTVEAAHALLKRGIPFAITTVETANAHAQAVMGFDELRGTLFLRDPYQPFTGEVLLEPFLKSYESSGPRGMVLAPTASKHFLEDMALPEAELYDYVHTLASSLARHDREAALAALKNLESAAPGHRMTWEARRDLAAYDANHQEILSCTEQLLAQFPKDANLQLSKLGCLRDGPRQQRVDFLESICRERSADPLIRQQYGGELAADAREHALALRCLRRSMRFRPMDATSFSITADILWQKREVEEALELYRFAACLEDKREGYARTYFSASRHLKKTSVALAFLEDRFRRFGGNSALPGMTLFWAYGELDQVTEAFATLDRALKLRPADGDLLRFAAEEYARWNRRPEAAEWLKRAEGKSQRTAWLRTAAIIASYENEPTEALRLWRQVLDLEPLAIDAQRAITQLLAETQGRAAAMTHLAEICAERPHSCALHQLRIEWLRAEGSAALEPALRHLVSLNPADTWARRELALTLADLRRFDEALAEVQRALEVEPNGSWNYSVRGRIHFLAGEMARAQLDCRTAIELCVDNSHAISTLIDTCASHRGRKEALEFVQSELMGQVVLGDGLLAFYDTARSVLAPAETQELLRLALRERGDLWHAHSAMILHLTDTEQLDEALSCARDATSRFPLVPRIWLDMARVCQARRDLAGERQALEQAVQINSAWSQAARSLAALHQRMGDLPRARQLLEQTIARDPLNALNHGVLAELLWQMDDKRVAFEAVEHAARLAPGYDWAWSALRRWATELKTQQLPVAIARDLTEKRPGDALSWLRLGEVLAVPETLAEAIAALDKAIALNPRCDSAYDSKAVLLAQEGRFDDALTACQPAIAQGPPPLMLRSRAAWIEVRRGNVKRAIDMMGALLKENPDYYWGWRELADWQWTAGMLEEAVESATALVRLSPLDPVPLAQRAASKLKLGDRAGAEADFRRAMELEPQYTYAGFSLFDLLMEDGSYALAGQALATIGQQVQNDWVVARRVRLAAAKKDREAAVAAFGELCASAEEDAWPLSAGFEALKLAGWLREARRIVLDQLEKPGNNANLAAVWVQDCLEAGKWRCFKGLGKLTDQPEKMRRGVVCYIETLAQRYQQFTQARDLFGPRRCRAWLRRAVKANEAWLRDDDQSWGRVGYALSSMGLHSHARAWLGDWRARKKAEPWMLYNLVLSCHQAGDEPGAREVVGYALQLPAVDSATPTLRLFAALEAALQKDAASASAWLREIIPGQLHPYDERTYRFIESLLEFVPEPKATFGGRHRQIMGQFLESNARNRSLARAFSRGAKLIAAQTGSRWPMVWAWLKRYGAVVGGVCFGVGYILFALVQKFS